MADDPTKQDLPTGGDAAKKTNGAVKKASSEVSATDLLNLWGGMSTPQPAQPPPPKPATPKPQPKMPKQEPVSVFPPDFGAPQPAPHSIPKTEFKPATLLPVPVKLEPINQEPRPMPPPKPMHEHLLRPEPMLRSEPMPRPEPKPAPEKIEPKKPEPKKPEAKGPEQPPKPADVIEGELVSSSQQPEQDPEMLEEGESFGDKMSEILQELNLGPRHIFYGLGCLAIAGFLIFGGVSGLKNINLKFWENWTKKTVEQPVKPANEISKEDTGIPQTADVGKISSASLAAVGATGIDAVNVFGSEFEGATSFPQYILLFSRMQNAYAADVNELLNKSTDRRSRLESHLALLKKLEENGTLTLQKIKSELDTISAEYDALSAKQIEQDKTFFEQLKNFNSKNADDTLSDFISTSRKIVTFKARFKALQKIESYYESGLPRLTARIKDIELNKEPLIKGIKVYDVKGSDLNLILSEDGESAQTQSRNTLGTQLGGGLKIVVPTSLNQSKGASGKDFIMNPYGK
ncbi:hypothetical protein HZA42_04970 [Candidatus Peregrinibacteria bacterium]|nr:hypothetical protein [Candidatus Peregrinibacteria bacterium]